MRNAMRISRDLYEPSARMLLSHFDHSFDIGPKFLSFSTFILNTPKRALYLKHLKLEDCAMLAFYKMAADLARVLSLCVNLESLSMEQSEWAFEEEADVVAIQSLTRWFYQ